jgi:hypothetical protein
MQHAQQFRFVRYDLLQWLALDPLELSRQSANSVY